jgi:NADH-quinone oxidoreductase subunit L
MYIAAIFLPLLGSVIAGLFGRLIGDRAAQVVTCTLLCLSGVLSLFILNEVVFQGNPRDVLLFTWIDSGAFEAAWELRFDNLTAVMVFVVSVVSAAIHIYSIGYMANDPTIPRFFSYLSLFTFFMLILVTADNLLQLYFGWEGVGLCSYFLIGYWYDRPAANAAAIKAFIVNRVGDFGFAIGILAIYFLFNTISYDAIFAAAPVMADQTITFLDVEVDALTLICLLLFMGAMGKSAQLGLHTWLPDAMEGPTPVSALIHAATMVTAGVFMVARFSPLFEYSPLALEVVAVVGASTAFFAATIGITQNDIKRVIAYSTISQLGYMFFACGVSAYGAAIFQHLEVGQAHLCGHVGGLSRARRHLAVRRLLLQGHHPRVRLGRPHLRRLLRLRPRHRGRHLHGLLLLAAPVPDLPRRAPRRREGHGPRPRVAQDHDGSAHLPRPRGGLLRLARLRVLRGREHGGLLGRIAAGPSGP